MFYVYLIKNQAENKTYIGFTSNLVRRLKEHKAKKPKLVYYEAYVNEQDARKREQILKQRGQAVRRLKERIKGSLKG
jgi:predicted GIY-YIG superfamily endonuclease